jgi:hypothetical protein
MVPESRIVATDTVDVVIETADKVTVDPTARDRCPAPDSGLLVRGLGRPDVFRNELCSSLQLTGHDPNAPYRTE